MTGRLRGALVVHKLWLVCGSTPSGQQVASEKTSYGTATPTADRLYYFATHLYGTHAMDAIQMHFYDYAPYIVKVLQFIRGHGGGNAPVYCWECGIMWPVRNGQLYNYDPPLAVSFLQKKAQLGFSNGMVQLIFLPMQWGSTTTTADLEKNLPLTCDEYNDPTSGPGLCPAGASLSNLGSAFGVLTTGQ